MEVSSTFADPGEVMALLRASTVFRDVPEEDLAALAAGFVAREFPAGEVAVREGERGHEIFLITAGSFDVFASEASGRHRLDTLGAGAIFGEIAALTGGRRYATVQAAVDSIALVNEEKNFHEVLRASRTLSEAILRSLDRYA
ncbi:MAG: cyclic nucleotide-binding domain-containing protein [Verrucomicrobiales bacterium]|nr:cyclic nucleotide-binding domain-containing protein [Verrucomicrobiae bacterium]